jgi:hypothetical protein
MFSAPPKHDCLDWSAGNDRYQAATLAPRTAGVGRSASAAAADRPTLLGFEKKDRETIDARELGALQVVAAALLAMEPKVLEKAGRA